jgi:hypothetical protein
MRKVESPAPLAGGYRAGIEDAGRRFVTPSVPSAQPHQMRLLDWREFRRNSLRGFAAVELACGLIIKDLTVHAKGTRSWVGMPGKPQIENGGVKVVDGKPQYVHMLKWSSRERGDRFSAAVCGLIEAKYPGALRDRGEP